MPGRVKIEKADYLFDGERTLVALTDELHEAMKAAMEAHAWPFLEELASWDRQNPESSIIHFADAHLEERDPASGAIRTLQKFMPVWDAS